MRKESHSAFFDINSKLQKRLDQLEDTNYDICQRSQGFATLNSTILSFLSQLQRIANDEKILFIQTNYINKNNDIENNSMLKYGKIFKTKKDFIFNYSQLSQNLSEFISSFACKSLCDEYTTSKVQEIRKKFFTISEEMKDMNYRVKFNYYIQAIPNHLPNSIFVEFHKLKTQLEASHFVQKINESSIYNNENLESLNKFYISLEPIRDRLLENFSSLKSTQDGSKIYQKNPSPQILRTYSDFNKYKKINSNLKKAFDTLFTKLRPYYVKIQRKQQQINILVSDLANISSDMYKTLKCLEDETNRYTHIECIYRKISVIDNSHISYENFFEPKSYTKYILKFIDEEKVFFKEVDTRIKYSKNQTNQPSVSASVVVTDNAENSLSIVHQQELLDVFTGFHNSIIKMIKRFDDKKIFDELEERLKKKKKLEADFPTKYPRANSAPKTKLLIERKNFEDTRTSVNCGFECINTDIVRTISELPRIEAATSAFTAISNLFKAEETNFENVFIAPASCEWANQVAEEFKLIIQNKKNEIEKVKKQYEIEKKKKEYANCRHPKTICLASCGHTFCDRCLNLELLNENSHYFCPKCQKEFSQNDIIPIKW